jgi:restriction system protein
MTQMYEKEVKYPGLSKRHILRSECPTVLKRRAEVALARWEQLWNQREQKEAKLSARQCQARSKEEKIIVADMRTEQAEKEIALLEDTLGHGINRRTGNLWDALEDNREFAKPKPPEPYLPLLPYIPDPAMPTPPKELETPQIPFKPSPPDISQKPSRDDPCFQPIIERIDHFIPGRVEKKNREAEDLYLKALEDWNQKVRKYNYEVGIHNANLRNLKSGHKAKKQAYRRLRADYEDECTRIQTEHRALVERANREHSAQIDWLREKHAENLEQWEQERRQYDAERQKTNRLIDDRHQAYLNCDATAIVEYCDLVLLNSDYPDYFPQDFELAYIEESRTLLVDYTLPRIEDMPTIKAIKYNQSRNEFVSSYRPESALNKLYEDVNYQIALRTLFELFSAVTVGAMDAVVFNGFVETVDKATGRRIRPCIMSIQVSRSEFEAIDLEHVDPKACFKRLKGVSAAKLQALAPVAPVAQINREDKRFVQSYDVAANLDDSVNLASMDWEDFEHLIRELFGKEFAASEGEVKVTQASRDGGVDAVAFDPDPIRGGKIVIQAKRYTNVVGVSAVRDLYGTVMNEGAIKGILVTTSHYGADAYEFAKGKPLTLLDGGNLLSLLSKHGHKARINLAEAKKEIASRVAEG